MCQRYTLYIADTGPPLKHNIVLVAEGDPYRFAASYTYIYPYIYLARSDKLYFEASEGVERRRRERSLCVFCIDAVLSCTLLRWKLNHCLFDCCGGIRGVFNFQLMASLPRSFRCHAFESRLKFTASHDMSQTTNEDLAWSCLFVHPLEVFKTLSVILNTMCFLYLSLLEIVFKVVCRDRLENKLRVCKQTVQYYTPILYNNGFGQTVIIHLFRTESAHRCQHSSGTSLKTCHACSMVKAQFLGS